jgi:glucose/arabinose dehydrogenase
MRQVQARAGAGVPSPNRTTLLRNANGEGDQPTKTVFLQGLNSPFGMALVGHDLYVANTDAIIRFPYADGDARITSTGTKVIELLYWHQSDRATRRPAQPSLDEESPRKP